MNDFMKMGAVALCMVGGGLFFAASINADSEGSTSTSQNSEQGYPGIAPFVPLLWAGAGFYYGQWYGDEATYNNDVNVNREFNQDHPDWNRGNAQRGQQMRQQWNGQRGRGMHGGAGRAGGARGGRGGGGGRRA